MVSNVSTQEHIIEMSVDSASKSYDCDEVFGPYQRNELPFEYQDGAQIENSERLLQSWYIENPVSKELVKTLVVRLSPGSEKEFIVVLKAPSNKPQFNLISFINFRLQQPSQLRRHQSTSDA